MITSADEARVDSVVPRLRWDVLTPSAVDRVHEAVLAVLAAPGVRFAYRPALDALESAGCVVDHGRETARVPRRTVMEALAAAPRHITLAGRDPAHDVPIDLRRCHLGNSGCDRAVADPDGARVRPSTRADVAASARFIDGSPAFALYRGPAVTGLDAPAGTRALHDAEAVLASTTKHFQTDAVVGEPQACYLAEMAAAVAGGRRELRRRPILSFVQTAAGPLAHGGPQLAVATVAARHGLPVGFSTPLPVADDPESRAAECLVACLATALAGVVLLQVLAPGAPCFLAFDADGGETPTGGRARGHPPDRLSAAACVQLAHFYGLPASVGMIPGAARPTWRAGVDAALSTVAGVMSWADINHGGSRVDGRGALSYPALVMEAEIWSIVRRMAAGIDVDQETMALETIGAVGPGGTFLGEKHTRRHGKGIWRPTVWDRRSRDVWSAQGGSGAWDEAREIAARIHAEHRPPLLPDDVAAGLRIIVQHADKELVTS